ncbi:MAG: hypothetical protein HYS98_00945 [Deltaproteobacteria bacterium]|nr:hypothetical protein [Deltaproteobacteria bacterium]
MTRNFDEILYDKRVVAKNISYKLVTQVDYEKFLKTLVDDKNNSCDILCDESFETKSTQASI